MNFVNDLTTRSKLTVLSTVAILAMMALALIAVLKLSEVNAGLDTVYNDRVVPLKQLKAIADAYAVNIVDTTHKTRNGNINFKDCEKNINEAKKIVDDNWKAYKATYLTTEEAGLAKDAEEAMVLGNETRSLSVSQSRKSVKFAFRASKISV